MSHNSGLKAPKKLVVCPLCRKYLKCNDYHVHCDDDIGCGECLVEEYNSLLCNCYKEQYVSELYNRELEISRLIAQVKASEDLVKRIYSRLYGSKS